MDRHLQKEVPFIFEFSRWCRPDVLEHQQAGVMTLLALLLAADAHRLGGRMPPTSPLATTLKDVYDALKRCGFAATMILAVEAALRNGIVVRLPPDFVDDMIAVCVSKRADGSSNPSLQSSQRLRWVERVLLHLQDTATVDTNALFRVCRCAQNLLHHCNHVEHEVVP